MGDDAFEIDPTSEHPIPEPVLPDDAKARVESILSDGMEDK